MKTLRFPLLLLYTSWLGISSTAYAADPVVCSAFVTGGVAFGNIDPIVPGNTDSASTLSYTCTGNTSTNYYVTVCFNIATGPLGVSAGNRQFSGPGGNLRFQLYSDASRTQPWGAVSDSSFPTPVSPPNFYIAGKASKTGNIPIYARFFGSQTNATPGSYTTNFAFPNVQITGVLSANPGNGNCGTSGTDVEDFSSFSATATVIKSCTVTANILDFGTPAGSITTNIDSTTTVQATCSNTTAYQIGLDNGQNASGTARRMAGGTSEFIGYELYRDSSRTLRWGNSPSTNTVAGSGTGSAQPAVTIYGRVPPQTTPSPGSYSDTITVNVTY